MCFPGPIPEDSSTKEKELCDLLKLLLTGYIENVYEPYEYQFNCVSFDQYTNMCCLCNYWQSSIWNSHVHIFFIACCLFTLTFPPYSPKTHCTVHTVPLNLSHPCLVSQYSSSSMFSVAFLQKNSTNVLPLPLIGCVLLMKLYQIFGKLIQE